MRSWVYTQGYNKGIELGFRQGTRIVIEAILVARALPLLPTFRAQLDAEARIDVLQAWLDRAITTERADDVFADPR